MRMSTWIMAVMLLAGSVAMAGEPEFKPIFDGSTLTGWRAADMGYWSVADGTITARSSDEKPATTNQFLVWEQGKVDDFELRLKYRIQGTAQANSGIQFRSRVMPDGHVAGYQADIYLGGDWTGAVFDELGRKMLAKRGEAVTIGADGTRQVSVIGDAGELLKGVKADDWNEYHITARGGKIELKINGQTMSSVVDDQAGERDLSGVLALQLHAGPAMTVQFKDIELKRLPLTDGRKKLVLLAGRPSHPPGQHEFNAGMLLLEHCLNTGAGDKVVAQMYRSNGWPADPTAFDNADAVVMYSDGGKGHFAIKQIPALEAMHKRGVGIGAIHYAVEPVVGEPQDHFLKWFGGAFEIHFSVNPHWDAEFKEFPGHPVARGVTPFVVRDEWYYNMRFREDMKGVTAVLTSIPTEETYSRPDGPHSGNAFQRALKGKPTILMWVSEGLEAGRGRGFGFTGGHFHKNWADENQRRIVLNAMLWIAGAQVPESGVNCSVTPEMMEANLDDKGKRK
jgi:type 1 glutamine amidotransferase